MPFLLSATTIKGPISIQESNSTQVAQQRTLGGSISRDYFGSNKRVWTLEYANINPTAFTTINTVYQTYLSTGTAVTWQSTESNYIVASTNVHIDLLVRKFNVRGSSYISDFALILTEA
jgi:hypothetical protein